MSRPRVITGVDDRGRPKAAWADPGPADTPAYGFMQPAYDATTIARRQATPEELAAARAREAEPRHLSTDNSRTVPVGLRSTAARPAGPTDAERMQASRQRGAERHVEVVAARRAPAPTPEPEPSPQEEPAMSDPKPLDTFEELAEAAAKASEAWASRQAAEIAWTIAQEALEAVLGEVDAILHPPAVLPGILAATAAHEPIVVAPREKPDVEPIDRSTSRTGEGQRPGQAAARDRRAAAVLAAMERHNGDRKAVAAELGMKTNALAMVLKHAQRRGPVPA